MDSLLKDGWSVREDVNDEQLGDLIYTHQIIINGCERPTILDIRREIQINKILN